MNIGTRRIDCGSKISRRRNRDGLSDSWIGGADTVDLEVTRQTGLINNFLRFHVDVAVDIELKVDMGPNCNLLSDIASYVDSDKCLRGPESVYGEFTTRERRKNVQGRREHAAHHRRNDSNLAEDGRRVELRCGQRGRQLEWRNV